VPFELMHLGNTDAIPSWLSKSALAPQLNDAVQYEHLLTVSASTAASCFLQAGVLRHATYLSSLAACYLFRAVWPPLSTCRAHLYTLSRAAHVASVTCWVCVQLCLGTASMHPSCIWPTLHAG
jgi:hypothetical protein